MITESMIYKNGSPIEEMTNFIMRQSEKLSRKRLILFDFLIKYSIHVLKSSEATSFSFYSIVFVNEIFHWKIIKWKWISNDDEDDDDSLRRTV